MCYVGMYVIYNIIQKEDRNKEKNVMREGQKYE